MIQTGNRNGFNFEWYRQTDKILRHRMDLTLSLDLALCFIRNISSSVMGSKEKVSKVGGQEDVILTAESKLQIRPCQETHRQTRTMTTTSMFSLTTQSQQLNRT